MLQFVTSPDNIDIIRSVIDGGCAWIEVDPGNFSGEQLSELLTNIMALCRDTETILTVRHDVDLTDVLKIHGVHLLPDDVSAADTREKLGPHAIIGVGVNDADEASALRGLDVDYITFGPFGSKFNLEDYRRFVESVRAQGVKTPIVAHGDITPSDVVNLLGAGVNGIAVSDAIAKSENPAEATRQFLDLLSPIY